MKRPLCALLVLALVLGTPGLPAWQALAASGKATTRTGGSSNVPGQSGAQAGVGSAAPGAVGVQPIALSGSLTLTPGAPVPALSPVVAPVAAAPSVAVAPVAAAPSAAPSAAASLPAASSGRLAPLTAPAEAPRPGAAPGAKAGLEAAGKRLADPKTDDASTLREAFEGGRTAGDASGVAAKPSRWRALLGRSAAKSAVAAAQAPAVPAAEAPAAKKGLLGRVKAVFDLSEFNASEKSYILGQAVFLLAISVYLASLPLMVQALTGDAAMTGVARMVHFWVFGGASLMAGAVVARNPMKRVLVGAAGSRAAIFGTIGVLGLVGGLPWAGFLALVGVNALIVSMNHLVDIDTGGAAKVFESDKKIEKAGYVYDFIYYGMMLTIPPLIGIPMDWLSATFGAGVGAAGGFALFAALMGVVAFIYGTHVKTIGESVVAAPLRGLRDAAGRAWSAARTFAGIAASVPARNWRTLKIVWSNKAVRARSMMATLENFVEDAIFAVVLPTYALEILGLGATGNGLLLSAITAGGLFASTVLVSRIQGWQKKYGTYRVLQVLTGVAALAFIPSAGLWLVPSLLFAVPGVFLLKLMLTPLRSRMRALLQTEIKNDPVAAKSSEDIYSLMTFFEVMAAGLGGLAFAWMFMSGAFTLALPFGLGAVTVAGGAPLLASVFGAMAPMKVVTLFMLGMGGVYLLGLGWVKGQLGKPVLKVHRSPEGNEAKMLAQLADSLRANGLPPYATETVDGPADAGRPTVVILAPASRHKVAIAREGGRQSPGDVHLVLDASWLTQEVYPDGRTKLLVRKAVVFDEKGQARVVEYAQQRRARYFADYFTKGANGREDGVVFETNLDIPQSNSLQLETVVNDKLMTRLLMAARAVAVPFTLALAMPAHALAERAAAQARTGMAVEAMPDGERAYARALTAQLDAVLEPLRAYAKANGLDTPLKMEVRTVGAAGRTVVDASALVESEVFDLLTDPAMTRDGAVEVSVADPRRFPGLKTSVRVVVGDAPWLGGGVTPLRRHIEDYLDRNERDEVVVKPSGAEFHSGYGVRFMPKSARRLAYAHALMLSGDRHMTDEGVALVDGRVTSAPLDRGGRKMETTLRVLAARAPWDGAATTDIFARVGPWGKPTTAEAADPRDNATVEAWDDLLAEWKASGLLDERSASELDAEVRALGPAVFAAIAEHEKTRARKDGAPYQAQTDLIGLDVMIERRVDAEGRVKLVPVVIEVNDHDSGGQYNLDLANRGTDKVGRHSREWMATALQRARRDALKGKRVVIVGAGYAGKRFIFEKAKKLGVQVVLVDKRTPFVAELIRDGLVSELIETDNTKPKEAFASAKKKLQRSIRKNGELGGVTSFWEDDLPLTADLAKEFGLPYHTQAAAAAVRSKDETLGILEKAGIQLTKRRLIRNDMDARGADLERIQKDFLAALDEVGVPAVLKPAGGAAAIGTKKIAGKAEALAVLAEVRSMARPEIDPIFAPAENRHLSLGEYFDGPEWDADIVMRDGKPLFVSLTDNWPTREPYFLATGSSLPSRRLSAKQQAEVEELVVKAAKALGLNNGVIHLEGKYTSKGARLIEANGRMGGEYVHDWVEAVWCVSLVEEGLLAAAGVKGAPFKSPRPLVHLEGGFIIPEKSGVIEAFGLPAAAQEQPGFHELRVKKQIGDRIAVPPAGYERAGMLVARGATAAEAQRNLDRLNAALLLQVK